MNRKSEPSPRFLRSVIADPLHSDWGPGGRESPPVDKAREFCYKAAMRVFLLGIWTLWAPLLGGTHGAGASEPSVVHWLATDIALYPDLKEAFERERPGRRVLIRVSGGPENVLLFEEESLQGAWADVVTRCQSGHQVKWSQDGLLRRLPREALGRGSLARRGDIAALAGMSHVILVNESIPQGQAPRGYADLSDPRWKGRIVMQDPDTRGFGLFLVYYALRRADLGWAWLKALHENKTLLLADPQAIVKEVSSGRRSIGLVRDVDVPTASRARARVRYLIPSGGFPYQEMTYMIPAASPHPEAADAFARWLASKTAREVVRDHVAFVTRAEAQARGAWVPPKTEAHIPFTPDAIRAAARALKTGELPGPPRASVPGP